MDWKMGRSATINLAFDLTGSVTGVEFLTPTMTSEHTKRLWQNVLAALNYRHVISSMKKANNFRGIDPVINRFMETYPSSKAGEDFSGWGKVSLRMELAHGPAPQGLTSLTLTIIGDVLDEEEPLVSPRSDTDDTPQPTSILSEQLIAPRFGPSERKSKDSKVSDLPPLVPPSKIDPSMLREVSKAIPAPASKATSVTKPPVPAPVSKATSVAKPPVPAFTATPVSAAAAIAPTIPKPLEIPEEPSFLERAVLLERKEKKVLEKLKSLEGSIASATIINNAALLELHYGRKLTLKMELHRVCLNITNTLQINADQYMLEADQKEDSTKEDAVNDLLDTMQLDVETILTEIDFSEETGEVNLRALLIDIAAIETVLLEQMSKEYNLLSPGRKVIQGTTSLLYFKLAIPDVPPLEVKDPKIKRSSKDTSCFDKIQVDLNKILTLQKEYKGNHRVLSFLVRRKREILILQQWYEQRTGLTAPSSAKKDDKEKESKETVPVSDQVQFQLSHYLQNDPATGSGPSRKTAGQKADAKSEAVAETTQENTLEELRREALGSRRPSQAPLQRLRDTAPPSSAVPGPALSMADGQDPTGRSGPASGGSSAERSSYYVDFLSETNPNKGTRTLQDLMGGLALRSPPCQGDRVLRKGPSSLVSTLGVAHRNEAVPWMAEKRVCALRTKTEPETELTVGILQPNLSYSQVELLCDTGGSLSVAGIKCVGMFHLRDIHILEKPEAVRTASGVMHLPAIWTGTMSVAGAPFKGSLYLAPDYVGGVIFGDDILNDLRVQMTTENGYRTITFTALGLSAVMNLKTRKAQFVKSRSSVLCLTPSLSTHTIPDLPTNPMGVGDGPLDVLSQSREVEDKAEVRMTESFRDVTEKSQSLAKAPLIPDEKTRPPLNPEEKKVSYPQVGPLWTQKLRKLWDSSVLEYPVLAMTEGQGPTVSEVARIPVTPGPPVVVPNYRSALVEKDFIKNKVRELLSKGIIKRTRSEWNSPILVVPKAGEERFRLVVDYRRLNKRIAGDTYPLPHIEDLLTKTAQARVFSKIDLVSGFHQVPVHEDDQQYLAFSALDDSYTYCYVPFGLNIAPALFTRALNRALRDCQDFIAVYVDDIMVYSSDIVEHEAHLKQVFTALGIAHFRVSKKKSTLGVEEVMYLGHILTPGRVQQDPNKVKAVKEFPLPTTVKQVRRFLGMCGYYRRFIKGFSKIASPLTDLVSGRGRVTLNDEQKLSFASLRNAMTEAPVLELFLSSRDTRVEVDSCSTGVGAVLTQEVDGTWKPVAFYSKKFPVTAKAYASREAETYGIYLAIIHWRVWLLGRRFTIISDHQSLVLSDHGRNSRRIQRWLLGLAEYTFDIKYRRGIMHSAPDALSRIWGERDDEEEGIEPSEHLFVTELEDGEVDPTEVPDYQYVSVYDDHEEVDEVVEHDPEPEEADPIEELTSDEVLILPGREEWAKATLRCRQLAPIARLLAKDDEKFVDRVEAKWWIDKHQLSLKQGVIIDDRGLKWVPEEFRMVICSLFHSTPFSMHHDAKRTLALLTRVVYWPHVDHYVKTFVKSCWECRVVKGRSKMPDLEVRQVEPIPFQVVAIDHAGPMPVKSKTGKRYILVAIDMFSGYPEAVPVHSMKAGTTARALMGIFSRYGWARTILSDNGGAFRNNVFKEMCKLTGVKHRFTITRHPQANGAAERLVKTIKQALDALGSKHNSEWEDRLNMILLGIRQSPRAPLWLSPAQIIFGKQIRGPADVVLDFDQEVELAPVGSWIFRRIQEYRETRLLLSEQQEIQRKERAEKDPAKTMANIKPGDLVLVFNPDKLLSDSRSLRVRWVGPYIAHRQVTQSTYQVLENGSLRVHHLSRMLPYDDTGLRDDHPMKERCIALHREYRLYLQKLTLETDIAGPEVKELTSKKRGREPSEIELPQTDQERDPRPVGIASEKAIESGTPRGVTSSGSISIPVGKGLPEPTSLRDDVVVTSLIEKTRSTSSEMEVRKGNAPNDIPLSYAPSDKKEQEIGGPIFAPPPIGTNMGIVLWKNNLCYAVELLTSGRMYVYLCGGKSDADFAPAHTDNRGNLIHSSGGQAGEKFFAMFDPKDCHVVVKHRFTLVGKRLPEELKKLIGSLPVQ